MGLAFRVIARLDVKGANVIKGVQFEGLRIVGKPNALARKYADEGADELLFIDTVASLYGRNHLESTLEETANDVFIPITAGGGIRSKEDARRLLRAGADKVALNTAALERPALIDELAHHFGSQAVCVSIEAKRVNGGWHAFTDCGRNDSGREVAHWAREVASRGAGEILVTSIDRDGTGAGCDLPLDALQCSVPLVASGGIGSPEHAARASGKTSALAIGAALHYGRTTIAAVKAAIAAAGREVR